MRRIRLVDSKGKILESTVYLAGSSTDEDLPRLLSRAEIDVLKARIETTLPEIDPKVADELRQMVEDDRIFEAKNRLIEHLVTQHDTKALWLEQKAAFAGHVKDERRFRRFMKTTMDVVSLSVAAFLSIWIFGYLHML